MIIVIDNVGIIGIKLYVFMVFNFFLSIVVVVFFIVVLNMFYSYDFNVNIFGVLVLYMYL